MADNNVIERDHRGVKQRVAAMLGFKHFRNAAITIASTELMYRIRRASLACGVSGFRGEPRPQFGTRYAEPESGVAHGRYECELGYDCVRRTQALSSAYSRHVRPRIAWMQPSSSFSLKGFFR
jgi:DDE domain